MLTYELREYPNMWDLTETDARRLAAIVRRSAKTLNEQQRRI
jgi:hypothetical protein